MHDMLADISYQDGAVRHEVRCWHRTPAIEETGQVRKMQLGVLWKTTVVFEGH